MERNVTVGRKLVGDRNVPVGRKLVGERQVTVFFTGALNCVMMDVSFFVAEPLYAPGLSGPHVAK